MGVQTNQSGWIRLQVTNNIPSFMNLLRRNQTNTLHEIGRFCKSKMDYYVAVDTGYLKSRNTYRLTGGLLGKNLVLLNNCHYAVYQEFGTYKMKGTPFMRPAVYNHLSEIQSIAGRSMGVGIN
jgi:HK97 gp10 family phage protein